MKRVIAAFIGILAMTVLSDGAGEGQAKTPPQVLRTTLSNGLRVVIVRNTLAPVVATAVNYLAGSDEAPPGFPGTAHAQEHMMFRGSPGLSADQLATIGSVLGGNFNANTRESLTQYLYTIPAQDLELALNIEALRMRDVNDAQADWDKEKGAIEQEVAQDLSNPFYVLYARLRAQMFAGTSYEHDALGTKASFDATSAQMLKAFYKRWYAPNNAILVVVGNVEPEQTLTKIKRLFGAIPPKTLPARTVFRPRPATAATMTMETDRPEATEILAMRMPGLDSSDFPALEVLSDILNNKRFRLYDLVVAGRASEAEFALDPLPHAGIGYAAVTFPNQANAPTMRVEMRSILKRLVQTGVSQDLVDAAKRSERRQTEFQKNSIEDLASVWSDAVALYGLPSPEADLTRIEKVTVADVNRVIRKYIDVGHAVSASLLPAASRRPVATTGGFGGQETITLGEGQSVQLPAWAQASLAGLSVPNSTLHPTVSKLKNGLTLIVQPETVSKTVTVFGHIRNRPETEEPVGNEGVSLLLERLLNYGTLNLDRNAFQEALDQLGATIRPGTDFSLKALAADFPTALHLLAENQLRPALPQQALQTVRDLLVQSIASRNASANYLAQRALRASLYPATDPSLRQATPQTVTGLTDQDVRGYFDRVYRPDQTTIVIVGNISPVRARMMVEKEFGNWASTGAPPPVDLPAAPDNRATIIAVPDTARVQDLVTLAQNMPVRRSEPDYYPLSLGNAVLGGGFYATRLSIDLRKTTGLVYSVGADIQAGRTRGAYVVRYASDSRNVDRAAVIVANDIRQLQTAPVPDEELTHAKALLLRRTSLEEASIDEIAEGLAQRSDLELPLDEPFLAARRYAALTATDVKQAFQKWMRPDDLVRVSQGPSPRP